jgi:hypothetical protein
MRRSLIAALSLLASCAGTTTEAPPPVPVAPPAPSEAPAPAVTVAATAEVVSPPAPRKSDFSVVSRFPGKDRLTLLGVEGAVVLEHGGRVFAIEEGRVTRDDAFFAGLRLNGWTRGLVGLSGHYPEPLFATLVEPWGRVAVGSVMRREQGAWKPVKSLQVGWSFIDVQKWDKGRIVGLAATTMYDHPEVIVVDGMRGVVPKLSRRSSSACPNRNDTEVAPSTFLAFPSGHFYVAGERCNWHTWAVEVFEPGKERGTVVAVPFDKCEKGNGPFTMAGVRADEVFFSGGCESSLLLFDGKAFTKVPAPEPLATVHVAPDGGVFLLSKTVLRRLDADGTWSELTPPAGKIDAAYFVSSKDIWATSGDTLLHTGPPPATVQEIDLPESGTQVAAASLRNLRGAKEGCESLYVLLYAFVKTTPEDYDFPLTRKALKGHPELGAARFVVTRDGGKKYFGAFVPDLATGRKLASVVENAVKDSAPQVLCVKPEELRQVKIDLATGEVVP